MANLNNFDASQVEPSVEFEPVPAGRYVVVITASQDKPTRNQDGEYLELTMEIVEGEYKGRRIWDRIMLQHSNPMTVKIARARLSSLCRACGLMRPGDSEALHNLPIVARVRLKARNDTQEMGNEIASYEARAVDARPTPPAATTPPWSR